MTKVVYIYLVNYCLNMSFIWFDSTYALHGLVISSCLLSFTLPRFLWAGLNRSISELEFRVFHNIFCDSYKIQKAAFAFDEYVEKVSSVIVCNTAVYICTCLNIYLLL